MNRELFLGEQQKNGLNTAEVLAGLKMYSRNNEYKKTLNNNDNRYQLIYKINSLVFNMGIISINKF